MLAITDVRGDEARAGRLMLGFTCDELADLADVSGGTVVRLENDETSHGAGREAVLRTLHAYGVRFVDRGDVRHLDGRSGILKPATGAFHGDRLRRARTKLGFRVDQVASACHLATGAILRMEAKRDLHHRPTMGLYRVAGFYQLAGYSFGPTRHQGVSGAGDRLLVPPKTPAVREVDWSLTRLRGKPRFKDIGLDAQPA